MQVRSPGPLSFGRLSSRIIGVVSRSVHECEDEKVIYMAEYAERARSRNSRGGCFAIENVTVCVCMRGELT